MAGKYDFLTASEKRNFRDYTPEQAVSAMLEDIDMQGYSRGWSGSKARFDAIMEIAKEHDIVYTDDFFGMFEIRRQKN